MPKTAIVYARVSTARQAAEDLPIEGQIEQCRVKAAELGASVEAVFTDAGISGREELRPGFQEAIAYAEEHSIDYIVVWSSSRFARDHIVAGWYKRRLEKRGIRVVSCTMETDRTTTGGYLLDSMTALFDELHSMQVSADTTRSMMKNARDGFWNGGRPPFGYQPIPAPDHPKRKALVPNPEEAWLVGQIFQWRASGIGTRVLAGRLNSAGYLHRGKRWTATSVHHTLRNPAVIGKTVFNRRQGRDKPLLKATSEVVSVDSHEAIVPLDLWEKVSEMMVADSPVAAGSPKSNYLFTGILKCGHCGGAMVIETAKGRSHRYSYYNCGTWLKTRECKSHRRTADDLDTWLLETILAKIFTPDTMREVAIELNAECGRWATERREKLRVIEAQLAEVSRRRANLFDVLEMKGREAPNLGDMSERLQQLKARGDALTREMAELESQPAPSFDADSPEIEAIQAMLGEIIRDRREVKRSRLMLGRLLESVVLLSDRAMINYRTEALAGETGKAPAVHRQKKWLRELDSNQRPSD